MNALFTVLLSILILFTHYNWIIGLLAADFALRIIYEGRFNPISRINTLILKSFRVMPVKINAGPKLFAARVGFSLSVLSGILVLSRTGFLAYIPLYILAFFAFLEGAFNFCVACKLYPVLFRGRINQA